VLKFGNLFEENEDEQWKTALNYLGTIPESNYLTQIVIMLYEDPNHTDDSDKRFHVELHFSPGSYTEMDQNRTGGAKPPSTNEEILHLSSGSEVGFLSS
jgi:hypothetical protein